MLDAAPRQSRNPESSLCHSRFSSSGPVAHNVLLYDSHGNRLESSSKTPRSSASTLPQYGAPRHPWPTSVFVSALKGWYGRHKAARWKDSPRVSARAQCRVSPHPAIWWNWTHYRHSWSQTVTQILRWSAQDRRQRPKTTKARGTPRFACRYWVGSYSTRLPSPRVSRTANAVARSIHPFPKHVSRKQFENGVKHCHLTSSSSPAKEGQQAKQQQCRSQLATTRSAIMGQG